MRKKMKVFLLICGIVVGIGVIFSVAGLAAGGIQGLARIQEKVPWISFGPWRKCSPKAMNVSLFLRWIFPQAQVMSDSLLSAGYKV